MSDIAPEDFPETFRPFASVLLQRDNRWHELTRLLGTVGPKAPKGEAVKMAVLLREQAPKHPFTNEVSDWFLRESFPLWYIDAINDRWRNDAYRQSLHHLARPDGAVLEVGTGSGLFAMMAIRAGFRHVYSFESNRTVARIARECIRRNGLEDRITIINKTFSKEEDIDLPEMPKVFMHEMSSDNLIVKDLFDILNVAYDLGVPRETPILPHHFQVRGQLSGDPDLHAKTQVVQGTEGFDLTPMNLLSLSQIALERGEKLKIPMSEPTTLASHDAAASLDLFEGVDTVDMAAGQDGTVYGVVHWICQSFPGGATYENTPGRWCNWYPHYWPFREPRDVKAGDTVAVEVTSFEGNVYLHDA